MGVIKTQLSFENCGTRCVERSTFGVVPRRLFFQIVTLRVIVADRRGVALPRSPGIASARCPVESTSGTGLRRGKYIFFLKKRFTIRFRPGYEHFILGRAMSPVGQREVFF